MWYYHMTPVTVTSRIELPFTIWFVSYYADFLAHRNHLAAKKSRCALNPPQSFEVKQPLASI